jgi:ATP-dependent Clp protease ATP-binding subunit ClpC
VVARYPLTLVVGEPGVGKTTLVRLLAAYAGSPDRSNVPPIPRALLGRPFFGTSVVELQAGASYVNELEGRVLNTALFVQRSEAADGVAGGVLCIEEVAVAGTAGATRTDPSGTVANALLPLVGGGLRVVGTTTPAGLDLLASTAAEFVARARIFRLWPTTAEETIALLDEVNRGRGSRWTRAAMTEAVALSSQLVRNRALPGKAFDVLREAETLARRVRAADVVRAVASLTGLRPDFVDKSVPLESDVVAERLAQSVFDQPEAVEAGARILLRLKTGLTPGDGPVAALLCLGPTGVGKTAFARALARLAYGSEGALLRRDMSEYAGYEAAPRFLGFGPRARSLPDAVASQPHAVVLLDEIEKASTSVIHLLLQLLGEGRLTGASGITADFRSAVVIITTNVASELFGRRAAGFSVSIDPAPTAAEIQRALCGRFPAEFVNRLEVVVFRPLSLEAVKIAMREVKTITASPVVKYRRVEVSLTDQLWERLAREGYDPAFGARPMLRAVQRLVGDPVAAALSRDPSLSAVRLLVRDDGTVLVQGPSALRRRQSA